MIIIVFLKIFQLISLFLAVVHLHWLCVGFLYLQQMGTILKLQCVGFSLWWLLKFIKTESRMMVPKVEGRGESGVIV